MSSFLSSFLPYEDAVLNRLPREPEEEGWLHVNSHMLVAFDGYRLKWGIIARLSLFCHYLHELGEQLPSSDVEGTIAHVEVSFPSTFNSRRTSNRFSRTFSPQPRAPSER